MQRTQQFTIDGKTYGRLEDMPPDVKKKWDAVSGLYSAVFGNVTDAFPQRAGTKSFEVDQTVDSDVLTPLKGSSATTVTTNAQSATIALQPYDSKWAARFSIIMASVFLCFPSLMLLGLLFTPAPAKVILFFGFMFCGFAFWLCSDTFKIHAFNKSPELWRFFGCPIVDFSRSDFKRGTRFLFLFPGKRVYYPLALKIHHNLCRLFFLLMLAGVIVAFVWIGRLVAAGK